MNLKICCVLSLTFRKAILLTLASVSLGAALLPRMEAQQQLPTPSADDNLGEAYSQSYHGGDIDSISLTNGTLSVNVPFLSYSQRGKLHLSFNLMYNNQPQHFAKWCPYQNDCLWEWGYFPFQNPLPIEKGDAFVGWAQQVAATYRTYQEPYEGNTRYFATYFLQFADGSEHVLGNTGSSSSINCPACQLVSNGPMETLDASGWMVNGAMTSPTPVYGPYGLTAYSVIDPDGTMYGTGEKDSNGNEITNNGTSLTDSLGRPIPSTAHASVQGQFEPEMSGCWRHYVKCRRKLERAGLMEA